MEIRMSRDNKRLLVLCISFTFLFGLLAHAFIFFNPSLSHDSLLIDQRWDNDKQISLGRFLQPIYRMLRGPITATWLIGFLSLIYLSLAVFLIVKLLRIRSVPGILVSCGILVTNTTLTFSYATYSPWADVYTLSLLLAVLALYICYRFKYGFIFGILLVGSSLALYQSYVSVAVVLAMLYAIKNILDGVDYKKLSFDILKPVGMVAGGGASYYIGLRVVLAVTGLSLSASSNGLNGLGDYSGISVKALLKNIYKTYRDELLINAKPLTVFCIGLIAVAAAFCLVKIIIEKKIPVVRIVMLCAIVFLLPLGSNIAYFLSKDFYHSLMAYATFFIYILAIMVCEQYLQGLPGKDDDRHTWKEKILPIPPRVAAAFVGILVFCNIVFSNGVYTKKYLQEQITLSTMTRVVDRIEQTDGYIPNETPIVFAGQLKFSILESDIPGFEKYKGIGVGNKFSVTYDDTYKEYFAYFMGYSETDVSQEKQDQILEDAEVEKMPAFPQADCCKMVDGYIVVKLSE